MEEKQEKCFTCGTLIRDKLYQYEYLIDTLKLSRTDAVDKVQLLNVCCRVTAFGQSRVEERVRAAGYVETNDNEMRTKGEREYPKSRVKRRAGEGPFKYKEVKLAAEHDKAITEFALFSGLKSEGIKRIPERRAVVEAIPEEERHQEVKRMSNRDVLGDVNRYINGKWTPFNVESFPGRDDLETEFTSREIKIHILIPAITNTKSLGLVRIPGGATTKEALAEMLASVNLKRPETVRTLLKSNLRRVPIKLDRLLEMKRLGEETSLFDVFEDKLVIESLKRVDKTTREYNLSLKAKPMTLLRQTNLSEDLLNGLNTELVSVEESKSQGYVMTFRNLEIAFTIFEFRNGDGMIEDVSRIPLGITLEAGKRLGDDLYISLSKGDALMILLLKAPYNIELKDYHTSLIDEDRKKAFRMLNSY